jgi:acylphosphatase
MPSYVVLIKLELEGGEMGNDQIEMHAIAKGRVQGVGFRATARYHANKLGLVGSVKNLPDATVEIYAQGNKSTCQQFLIDLETDLGLGQIDTFTTDFYPITHQFNGFKILF